MMVGLEVKDLWAGYHGPSGFQVVLTGLSLSAEKGRVSVVLGPSGSGKTTLINCIAGLHGFDRGAVIFTVDGGGRFIEHNRKKRLTAHDRRQIGVSFQQSHLWSHMSVRENLIHPQVWLKAVPRAAAAERADALLASLDLTAQMHSAVTDLSGGQRQRVAILRALALRPEVLLLDEITASQDPANVQSIFNLIKSYVHENGCTALTISHDMNFVRRISDYVYFLKDGAIAVHGTSADLLRGSGSEELQEFINAFKVVGAG